MKFNDKNKEFNNHENTKLAGHPIYNEEVDPITERSLRIMNRLEQCGFPQDDPKFNLKFIKHCIEYLNSEPFFGSTYEMDHFDDFTMMVHETYMEDIRDILSSGDPQEEKIKRLNSLDINIELIYVEGYVWEKRSGIRFSDLAKIADYSKDAEFLKHLIGEIGIEGFPFLNKSIEVSFEEPTTLETALKILKTMESTSTGLYELNEDINLSVPLSVIEKEIKESLIRKTLANNADQDSSSDNVPNLKKDILINPFQDNEILRNPIAFFKRLTQRIDEAMQSMPSGIQGRFKQRKFRIMKKKTANAIDKIESNSEEFIRDKYEFLSKVIVDIFSISRSYNNFVELVENEFLESDNHRIHALPIYEFLANYYSEYLKKISDSEKRDLFINNVITPQMAELIDKNY